MADHRGVVAAGWCGSRWGWRSRRSRAVWGFGGGVWSFTEQSAFARAKGFSDPALLPLVLDGLAVAMARVAFAASLDARPAVGARLGTALAVVASASSNGLWAAERSSSPVGPDWTTVAIGAGVPIAANIAFEVLLGELRRQVQRRRGLPAPVALPSLRLLRLLLAPRPTFQDWRDEVLARTATIPMLDPAAGPEPSRSTAADRDPSDDPARRPGAARRPGWRRTHTSAHRAAGVPARAARGPQLGPRGLDGP